MARMNDFGEKVKHDEPWFEPIAIIGMAMRLPGNVRNGEDFWELLSGKGNALCEVPEHRFNVKGFFDGSGGPGTIPTSKGYFLEDVNVQEFDSSVFPIPKSELERLDPSQRQLLQVAYECMEDAGIASWRGSNLGCYIACFGEDWQDLNAKETHHTGGYRATGYADFALSNRVSYEFDLRGPSMTVKTACSSSLVSLDMACMAIRNGECDGALVGGSSLIFSPTMWLALQDQGVLSPTGQCHSFDASADGYARGEAVNVILIKRASDAIRDKDPIRAIIRGTCVNADGRTNGMLIPSPSAQAALMRRTYTLAGITNLSETAIVEAHGTGTPVGDPLEAQAVADCFGDEGVIMTSVKPNVGHSEGAAGLTSLIKCVLELEHRTVIPNINFRTPNPKIPFEKYRLHVPTELEPWPKGRAERVSVNSFGIGGANAHVILESPRQFGLLEPTHVNGILQEENARDLLLFSAYNPTSLASQIAIYQNYVEKNNTLLRDLAYSLANRRERRPCRAFAVASDSYPWQISSYETIGNSSPRVAWVFTGQGAQWPGMGAQLLDRNPTFRNTIRKLDGFLQTLPVSLSWTIEDELRKDGESSRVHEAEMGYSLSVALQIGLVDVLRSWGVEPNAVIGHSSGEIAAGYASGAITAESAIAAGIFRGALNTQSNRAGSMAAVGLGRESVLPHLLPGVVIACENSQCSTTLSGDLQAVEFTVQTLKEVYPGVLTRFLRVQKAYHSHHMEEYGDSYEDYLQPYLPKLTADPRVPFYSSVSGARIEGTGKLGPSYWRVNMESPVLFNSALRSALRDENGDMVLIEIGPHSALGGPIRQILGDLGRSDFYVGTLTRGKKCHESMLNLAGSLFQKNVVMDYSTICPPGNFLRNLPRYPWRQDTTHWAEPRVAYEWRFRDHPPHELLGNRVYDAGSEPIWRKVLHLEQVPWLKGHEVNTRVVFPAAAYISMTGEVLRQLENDTTFSVRNMKIMSALVLEPDKPAEIITTFKPIMIDTSEKSPWYAFTITSYDGVKWTTNCSGEARASTDKSFSLMNFASAQSQFPRKVDKSSWYNHLRRVGFNYTGPFRGLQSISSATTGNEAAAIIPSGGPVNAHDAKYALHPSVIDKCFQLFAVAAFRGLGRTMNNLAIPVFIEEMVIVPARADLYVTAVASTTDAGSFNGNLLARNGEGVHFSVRGFKTAAITADIEAEQAQTIARLEWMPSGNLTSLASYIHPQQQSAHYWPLLEELVILCVLEQQDRVYFSDETPQHLAHFAKWMRTYTRRYAQGGNVFLSQDARLLQLSSEERKLRIESIAADMTNTSCSMFSTAIYRLFKSSNAIFAGKVHPLSVLLEDDILAQIYVAADSLGFTDAIQLMANTNPRLRILEIGAGTGGTTAKVLRALMSPYGERLYATYMYTDISSGFMAAAAERFAAYENIEYAVLDISRDPIEQGFQPASFDLIVCANVLHATPSLQTSLRHVYELLSPGGRLFLEELCPESKFMDYIYGYLPGWWLGVGDGREEQPYISPERWSKELPAAGFQKPDAIVLDREVPYHLSAGILASRENPSRIPTRLTLLCYSSEGYCVIEMLRFLEERGIAVDVCVFSGPIPDGQDVISLLDVDDPLVHQLSEDAFETLKKYLQIHNARLFWVMPASQVGCEDPRSAMTLGLMRTARNELYSRVITIEVESTTKAQETAEAVFRILLQFSCPCDEAATVDPDFEYAVKGGEILIPRFHWQTVSQAAESHITYDRADAPALKRLEVRSPGLLRSLTWKLAYTADLAAGDVMIETKAAGMNFRDLLIALGVLDNSTSEIGLEGSGIVRAVGSGVTHLSVGDRVAYMSSGCFATHKAVPAVSCVKMNTSMSFEQGAAIPCVYATAILALIDKANLQKGQSVLIQSACGGVGLAAVQISQMVGAEIYCTVGSDAKVQYLIENYGINRSHIFNSRDASFLPTVLEATNNRGVDVVLNSLSGDLLQASWKCVAEFGVMVEIGKRDFRRRAKLSMEDFEQNRTFIGLDLWQISQTRPKQAAELVERCFKWIESDSLRGPIIACTFPALKIQEAFRAMQAAQHIGKIVVTMTEDHAMLKFLTPRPTATFRPDRSYLLVGGLGGLGRAVANWMVENGARHMIFLSRSAQEDENTRGFLEELRSQNCQVYLVCGSASNIADVQKAASISTQPVAGVINMAMVLKDMALDKMGISDWNMAVEPKVQGTWNLHNVLPLDIDFFVLFSSFTGIVGQPGQANYAAANTFLDAFASYRNRNGYAASAIDIGVMGDVGFVSRNHEVRERFEKTGMRIVKEQDLLDALALAVRKPKPTELRGESRVKTYQEPSQFSLGVLTSIPLSSPHNRVAWRRDPRMAIYHNLSKSSEDVISKSKKKKGLKEMLELEVTDECKTEVIARAIAGALANFLIKDEETISIERPLESLGMDSLVAMEVRNWIRQQTGVESSVFTIVQSPSLLNLADRVRQAMGTGNAV